MGYDLHIIRGNDWSEAIPIAADEWAAVVAQLPDFELTGTVMATTTVGEMLRYDNPDIAEWTGHPTISRVPFDFRDGQVVVKNPERPTIARMVDLASVMAARVQGDDGEWYE